MSSLGTYLAAGAAVAGVSEATGATAFTPVGQQARQTQESGGGGGGSGPVINLPEQANGGVSADVLEQLADSFQQQQQPQQSGPSALEVAQLVQSASGDGGAASALSDALEQQRERSEEMRQRYEERLRQAQEGDFNGDGEKDTPSVPEITLPPGLTGGDDSSNDDSSSDPDDFKLQDLDGRGPYGVGTLLAAGGETGVAAGDTYGKTTSELGKIGNTGSQVFRALAGKEYSAENTLAEDIHGTEKRRIDFDDYNPLSGNDSSKSSKSSKSSTSSSSKNDKKKPDVFGLGGGTDAINPSGNSFSKKDSRSSRSNRDEKKNDEPIISLPDSVKKKEEAAVRKIQAGNAHQIGGL